MSTEAIVIAGLAIAAPIVWYVRRRLIKGMMTSLADAEMRRSLPEGGECGKCGELSSLGDVMHKSSRGAVLCEACLPHFRKDNPDQQYIAFTYVGESLH